MSGEDVLDLNRGLGRIEGKLDLLLDMRAKDDKRITALERRSWWTAGAAAVLAYIGVHVTK